MAQTTHIQVHMGHHNAGSGNITDSFNIYKSDEDAQIMRWLSPLEPNTRHQGVRTERFDGVGDWLLEESKFREWRSSEGGVDRAVLFCNGNPGVGKTYLSSLVIDSLCDQARNEDIVVAGLYCDYLSQQEQTITSMMGAILKQLVGRGDIPEYLREAFQKEKTGFGGRGLRLPDLMGMLRTTISSLSQVFICIDALDECLPKYLPELLESLGNIVRESPRTRIFLPGRPQARDDIQRYFTNAIVIPISPKTGDIRSYLEMRLDRDTEPEAMSDDLRADIIKVFLERISDIFLLVSLNIDAILGEVTIYQRRKKLERMTQGNGLSDAYTATLSRLKAQKGNKPILGLKVLMWVLYSERPLRVEELRHALGVEIGSADQDAENVPALRVLLASSLGLVTVEESSSTARLVHITLKEHLSNDPTLFHSPHSTIAEVCLTYLNLGCVWDLSPTLDSAPPQMPFLEYASCHWGEHARREMTENVKILTLRLLDGFDKHISAQLLLLHYNRDNHRGSYYFYDAPYSHRRGGPRGFTGLHGAAYFGMVGTVAALLEMREWNVNATDCIGNTPLTWAAGRGHGEVVKVLLEREDVNPDMADAEYGWTPLYLAAEKGREGVVKMLLEREDVDPGIADKNGRTPLWTAVGSRREGVVKMLLAREDVNPNTTDKCGRTPLSEAVGNGYEGIVKMLLEREDINPNTVDFKYGLTPLCSAAGLGHEGLVKVLLGREGVNPNTADTEYGLTPLCRAAVNGRKGVVKMLLERENVNPNIAFTKSDLTLLSWAAAFGHKWVVSMLLQRGDVNPNTVDTEYGRTPLSRAAANGHECIVETLLEIEDVNPNTTDQYGLTPLLWAAANGHWRVVSMILEREEVNPNTADIKYGRTPLCWAAGNRHKGVIKMLLEREGINPNTADTKYGQTPLYWATDLGHEEVVKMLLERRDVNPNTADTEYGQIPLCWAAENGHEGVVKTLCEREDVNPNTAGTGYGRGPLSWAAGRGHERIAEALLEREEVNPNTADIEYGQTPLYRAAGFRHEVAKILLELRDGCTLH